MCGIVIQIHRRCGLVDYRLCIHGNDTYTCSALVNVIKEHYGTNKFKAVSHAGRRSDAWYGRSSLQHSRRLGRGTRGGECVQTLSTARTVPLIPDQGSGDGRTGTENERHAEEAMLASLFTECDQDNEGWVLVERLIEFIRNTLDVPLSKENEDTYDSDDGRVSV